MDGVYVEISMNANDQYRLLTSVFLIRLTQQSVNHHLREFNIAQKNTNELGPAWHIAGNHCIREQKKIACENIRFFSLFAAGETSPAAKREEKRMFSQAKKKIAFSYSD